MIRNRSSDHKFGCSTSICLSITHSGRQRWLAKRLTRTQPSWSHKLKRDSSGSQFGANQLASLCAHQSIADTVIDGLPWGGILYKVTFAHSPRCIRRRRIDVADINTRVTADQCAANCLEEAVRSFTAMRNRCRSSRADVTFRSPLPVFRVVWCSSVHYFQTLITMELLRCTQTAIAR